jgi:hypothetical protein
LPRRGAMPVLRASTTPPLWPNWWVARPACHEIRAWSAYHSAGRQSTARVSIARTRSATSGPKTAVASRSPPSADRASIEPLAPPLSSQKRGYAEPSMSMRHAGSRASVAHKARRGRRGPRGCGNDLPEVLGSAALRLRKFVSAGCAPVETNCAGGDESGFPPRQVTPVVRSWQGGEVKLLLRIPESEPGASATGESAGPGAASGCSGSRLARAHLTELAKGAPDARLTREAAAACKRLEGRK